MAGKGPAIMSGNDLMTLLGAWKALREGRRLDDVIQMVADWQRGLTLYAGRHGMTPEVVACMDAALHTKRVLRRMQVEIRLRPFPERQA